MEIVESANPSDTIKNFMKGTVIKLANSHPASLRRRGGNYEKS
jgi:hypothetical protein